MAKIIVKTDCGNAPKKEFIRDFEIAFTKKDPDIILNALSDTVHWEMIGEKIISGKEEAKTILSTMLDGSIEELIIEIIITHGDTGAANGTMKFTDGSMVAFCDVFTFTSHGKKAQIKKLQSYVLNISEKASS